MQKLIIIVVCLGLLFLPTVSVNSEQTEENETTVTMCHDGNTISVAETGVSAHLEHGDTKGACPETPESSKEPQESEEDEEDEESEEDNGKKKVTICHKGRTITVAEAALPAHLKHDDTKGACSESRQNKTTKKQKEKKRNKIR